MNEGLSFVFDNLPLPPTSNHAYSSFMRGGKVRHVCSKELTAFKGEFAFWALTQRFALKAASAALRGIEPLAIHCEFRFNRSAFLTKDGRLKKMDVSNRIKPLHDALCAALEIDDCVFTRVSAEKLEGKPGCRVVISALSSQSGSQSL